MKNYFKLLALAVMLIVAAPAKAQDAAVKPPVDFYSLSFKTITGEKFDFKTLKGKNVLIVNTASKCGYTPQFKDLEELNQKYGNNLVIIGFPSNDFMNQDPGTNEEIKAFCEENYGVTFLMMDKSSVKGKDKNEVYKWLTDKSKNGWNEAEPSWNFNKYLIDKKGTLKAHFGSKVKPLSEELISKL